MSETKTIDNDRWISLIKVCYYLGVKRYTVMRWIDHLGTREELISILLKNQTV